jgi:hypothetical protein
MLRKGYDVWSGRKEIRCHSFMLREVFRGWLWLLIAGYPWNLSVPCLIISVALAMGSKA